MRWHRRLVAEKWDFSHRRGPGRPGVMREIAQLIVRMAQDNPKWGYTRIQGALSDLCHQVGRGTVANVLKREGIEPAPERGKRTRWSTFLRAHWKVLAASDFLAVDIWTGRGLVTHHRGCSMGQQAIASPKQSGASSLFHPSGISNASGVFGLR